MSQEYDLVEMLAAMEDNIPSKILREPSGKDTAAPDGAPRHGAKAPTGHALSPKSPLRDVSPSKIKDTPSSPSALTPPTGAAASSSELALRDMGPQELLPRAPELMGSDTKKFQLKFVGATGATAGPGNNETGPSSNQLKILGATGATGAHHLFEKKNCGTQKKPKKISIEKPKKPKRSFIGRDKGKRANFLTWNNYTECDIIKLESYLKQYASKWAIQEEVCPTTGTPHLQGSIHFKNTKLCKTLASDLKGSFWRPTAKEESADMYCLKKESRKPNGRQWIFGIKILEEADPLEDPLKDLTLYPFQKFVIDTLSLVVDKRKIFWFFDMFGNAGKSALCKHVCMNYQAIMVSGKTSDAAHGIAEMIEPQGSKKQLKLHAVLYDIPRSCDEGDINYGLIEKIKNGHFFTGKYESKQIMFNPPHVFVFSNRLPNLSKLSPDRWEIYRIHKDRSMTQETVVIDEYFKTNNFE